MRKVSFQATLLIFGLYLTACSQERVDSGLDASLAAERHIEAAKAYIEEGNTRKGLYHLKKSESFESKSFKLFHTYAMLYQAEGDAEQEERFYKKALRQDRDNPQAKNNYGSFLCFHGEPEEGLDLLVEATEDYSYIGRAEAFVNKGLCELELDRIEGAENSFQQALRLNTHSSRPLVELASIYVQKGDMRLADTYYQRFARQTAQQNARTLWLGIQIAEHKNDNNTVSSYGLMLEKRFPDSPELELYKNLKNSN